MQTVEITSLDEIRTVVESIKGDFLITLEPSIKESTSSSRGSFERERESDYDGAD